MERLAYESPDGEMILEPTGEILGALLERGADYWQSGSGSASIGWVWIDERGYAPIWERPSLHLLVHQSAGVHIAYRVVTQKPFAKEVSLAAYDPQAPEEDAVTHDLGGCEATFPRASFLDKAIALGVIQDFLQTQEPSPRIAWREFQDVGEGTYGYAPRVN